jgi:hypothetical protein
MNCVTVKVTPAFARSASIAEHLYENCELQREDGREQPTVDDDLLPQLRSLIIAALKTPQRPSSVEKINGVFGAQEKTRTSTTLRPQVPETCASTNSATWAAGSPKPAIGGGAM